MDTSYSRAPEAGRAGDAGDACALGYAPLVDRRRRAVGIRFTLELADSSRCDDIRAHFDAAWPESAAPVVLALSGAGSALEFTLGSRPAPRNAIVEIDAAALANANEAQAAQELVRRGWSLALRGCPAAPLPAELRGAIAFIVVDPVSDAPFDLEAFGLGALRVQRLVIGARSVEDLDRAFQGGATASVGWPIGDPKHHRARPLQAAQATVIDALQLARRDAPAEDIDACMKHDPALAFKLLRLVNSSAFGNRTQITSLKQAVMLMGYRKLTRWLALLLATASSDVDSQPLMHLSVRRGLFLDQLREMHADAALGDDLFVTGAFSMLDYITGVAFDRLFELIALPEAVVDALASRRGRYAPFLDLVEAIERSDAPAIREHGRAAGIEPDLRNRALLAALASANSIEASGGLG